MLAEILTAPGDFPAHLHRHILQLYVLRHRRPPLDPHEQRRAVYEYLTRGARDAGGRSNIHASAELAAWLTGDDESVRGFGPVPRLMAIVHRFDRNARRQFDLETERGYTEFACRVALTLACALRWPEELIAPALREVLWEPAPGVSCSSRLGVTRGLNFVRRHADRVRHLDLARPAELAQLALSVLADLEQGRLPSYVLSPAQYAYLAGPVDVPSARITLTGLLHCLIVERGTLHARDLRRPEVVAKIRREVPVLLSRLRLPAPIREAHAEFVAPVLPMPEFDSHEPIVTLVGPVGHGSGLGAAARASVEAFKAAGIAHDILEYREENPEHFEAEPNATTRIRGDVNVLHFNPDVLIENLSRFGLEQFESRYNIGFFYWETTQATLAHRLGADLVDEIWVASEYCREVFERVTDKPVVVVRTPVPKIGDRGWASRRVFGLREDAFTFVYTFDGASRFTRKNPLGVLDAFQLAFPTSSDVQLVLKTQNTDRLHPPDERIYAELRRRVRADRRVVIIDERFSSNEVHGLIGVCDCYVALHRSEGFGYGMAEAMKMRVPVIATAHSGNVDFTTEETAYPVRCRLVPVPLRDFVYEEPGQLWAEPDVEHAAERMREVVSDPDRSRKLDRAFALIERLYREDSVGALCRERIDAIRAALRAGAPEGGALSAGSAVGA